MTTKTKSGKTQGCTALFVTLNPDGRPERMACRRAGKAHTNRIDEGFVEYVNDEIGKTQQSSYLPDNRICRYDLDTWMLSDMALKQMAGEGSGLLAFLQ